MLRLWLVGIWLLGSAASASAAGAAPLGRWLSADHTAVIQIAPCGQELCGQIVGIYLAHPGDRMPMNWRGQPQCGEIIIQTHPVTTDAGRIRWVGTVLDPRDGDTYHASIGLDAEHDLRLRGWLGLPIFGMTQTWYPYAGRTLAGCKLPGNSLTAQRAEPGGQPAPNE